MAQPICRSARLLTHAFCRKSSRTKLPGRVSALKQQNDDLTRRPSYEPSRDRTHESTLFVELSNRGLLDACTNEKLLEEGRSLRVYCGFDPTADSLHIGNLLGIVVLSWFQTYGHKPVALIGGATARVGDPSGKSTERPVLEESVIQSNGAAIANTLKRILFKGVDSNQILVVNNFDWYSSMSILDFLRDIGKFSRVGTMLAKDSVKSRLQSENGISFTEFSYQLLQGYDFVHLWREHDVSVQVGGSDQWGNITAGTDLIHRLEPSADVSGLTFPLLLKSDGTKFGKSEQGAIWLSAERLSPYKFYQYFLSVEDSDVIRLLKMLTFLPLPQIQDIETSMKQSNYVMNSAQTRLAEEVTRFVHGIDGLQEAQQATAILKPGLNTELDVQALSTLRGVVPSADLPMSKVIGSNIVDLVVEVGLQPSKGATKRLIKGGGLQLNNVKVMSDELTVCPDDVIGGKLLLLAAGKKNKLLVSIS